MKECKECGKIKEKTKFHIRKLSKDGLRPKCIECVLKYNKENYSKKKEILIQKQKIYRLKNIDEVKKKDKIYHEKNKEKRLQNNKQYHIEHKEEIKKQKKIYRLINKKKISEGYLLNKRYFAQWYIDNKEIHLERSKKWHTKDSKENPAKYKVHCARYRYKKYGATPIWVKKEDFIYICENCPKGHEVDHIIPLTHNLVCGLHVPWNLQILTQHENKIKKNKFDGTYENESWRI